MVFSYKINDKNYFINGIKLKDFKNLQLLLQLNDNTQIINYFNSLYNFDESLDVFKQLELLLYNLIITTRSVYEFTLKNEDDKFKYSIKIENILNTIKNINIKDYTIKINEDSYVIIGIPNTFFIYNEETLQKDILNYNTYNYFKKIVIENEEVPLEHIIIDNLPSNILSAVSIKISEWDNILKNTPFFNDQLKANCQLITLFEFVKKLFIYDQRDLIKKEYTLFKYIRICNYDTINLNEANTIIDIFNEDLAEQQEEIEKSTNNNGIDLPNRYSQET